MCYCLKVIQWRIQEGALGMLATLLPHPQTHTHLHTSVQFLSFSCSFQQKKWQNNNLASAPLWLAYHHLENLWIRHCKITDQTLGLTMSEIAQLCLTNSCAKYD